MQNDDKTAYIRRTKPQHYKPADPTVSLDIILAEREKIVELMLKLVELTARTAVDRENEIAAAKFEKVEKFVAINHGWPDPKPYDSHQPTMKKDRRAEGKGTANLHCDDCNHNYDIWQAKCPRCVKMAETKHKRILAENGNMKSFFNLIIGE